MYSIKLVHGQAVAMSGRVELVKTVYAQLEWEDDDGTKTNAARTQSCRWTPKTAKAAEDWARRKGLDLKAEYGAYLRKHGERMEVVRERKGKEVRAEQLRIRAIRSRCADKWQEIINALRPINPDLANQIETGA